MMKVQTIIILLFSLTFTSLVLSQENLNPEALYRKAVSEWRSKRSWEPWMEFCTELLRRVDEISTAEAEDKAEAEADIEAGANMSKRLELIGAFEEGILVIERATVARGAGEDVQRDVALSKLYAAYGKVLFNLSSIECHNLALDPHTLLIGAETVKRQDDPSTKLCVENAENALRNASTLDATNTESEQLLEQLLGENSAQQVHVRKPKEFVAELFDSFAETFDEMLLENLQYKVPQLVGDLAISKHQNYNAILDAGCGTGLAGRLLKPSVKHVMIGVDASKKMLDIASKCTLTSGCGLKEQELSTSTITSSGDIGNEDKKEEPLLYDGLLALDLEDMTIENTLHTISGYDKSSNSNIVGFDLIVAADVLVYFGSIANLVKVFASISTPGAILIFSCERATNDEAPLGWRLLSSGRFAHTKSHAFEAASAVGYELFHYEEIVPRIERGEDVKGHLFGFVLNKKNNDGKNEL